MLLPVNTTLNKAYVILSYFNDTEKNATRNGKSNLVNGRDQFHQEFMGLWPMYCKIDVRKWIKIQPIFISYLANMEKSKSNMETPK